MDIQHLLQVVVKSKASDLHLMAHRKPIIRVDGMLQEVTAEKALTAAEVEQLVLSMLSPDQKELFKVNRELDFSFAYENTARFRVNAYHVMDTAAAALRLLPLKIPGIDELGLPAVCHAFAELHHGFILATGPTGHGKSTTLASILDEINHNRAEHVVTVEDPVEYLHSPELSIISQREMHSDTHSWEVALRSVLREDPNVVLIGEMRDYETIAAALTIAETGHLVFATLHTNSASQTIDRIVDVFPTHQQQQIRMQLAATLEAVFSQRLLPAIGGGRTVAYEVMLGTAAVRNSIREGKTHLIDNIIRTSAELGMLSLEACLARLVQEGNIAGEVAMRYALRPDELERLLHGRK
jgi:twitching motility protein PilT